MNFELKDLGWLQLVIKLIYYIFSLRGFPWGFHLKKYTFFSSGCFTKRELWRYYGRKKNWRGNKKTSNIEKAVTFFLAEMEQKFKQIWRGNFFERLYFSLPRYIPPPCPLGGTGVHKHWSAEQQDVF
jgi:hypothetical protein